VRTVCDWPIRAPTCPLFARLSVRSIASRPDHSRGRASHPVPPSIMITPDRLLMTTGGHRTRCAMYRRSSLPRDGKERRDLYLLSGIDADMHYCDKSIMVTPPLIDVVISIYQLHAVITRHKILYISTFCRKTPHFTASAKVMPPLRPSALAVEYALMQFMS